MIRKSAWAAAMIRKPAWAAMMIRRTVGEGGKDDTPMDVSAGDDDPRTVGCAHAGDGDPCADGCALLGLTVTYFAG